jgi:hypothetical protein
MWSSIRAALPIKLSPRVPGVAARLWRLYYTCYYTRGAIGMSRPGRRSAPAAVASHQDSSPPSPSAFSQPNVAMTPIMHRSSYSCHQLPVPIPWSSSAARNRLVTASLCSGSRARLSARYQHRSQQAGPAPGKARGCAVHGRQLLDVDDDQAGSLPRASPAAYAAARSEVTESSTPTRITLGPSVPSSKAPPSSSRHTGIIENHHPERSRGANPGPRRRTCRAVSQ